MINVVVAGASGRVGTLITQMIEKEQDLNLAGKADIDAPLENVIDKADVIIDFTTAGAAAEHAMLAAAKGKPIIIGTTGLSEEQNSMVSEASSRVAVFHAPNMSLGVAVLFHLIRTATKALGNDFHVEISETHHTKKLDSPSGTALRMRDTVAEERAADQNEIKVTAFREGDVVGDHTIAFASAEEVLEIKHSALTRELFARGAIVAARWIVDKPAGLYDMSNVLGLI
jgi:4-hydroxy-tetrahydrodipicolinate reductase